MARVLKILFFILILCFPLGELSRFQLQNGIAFSFNELVLSVLFVCWISPFLLNKKRIKLGLLGKSIIIFTLFLVVSLLLNVINLGLDRTLIASLYTIRWLLYASLFFIVGGFDKKFKSTIPTLLLIAGILFVVVGYVQYFFYPSLRNLFYLGWDEHLYRMFSSFFDPNFAGAFFVLFLLFTLGLTYQSFKEKLFLKTLILSIIAVFTLIAAYLTYSRSALLMLFVGVITFLFLIGKRKMIIISLILLILIIFVLPKSFSTEGTNFLRIASSEARIDSAKVALRIFESSPLYGVGFNAYRYAQNKIGLNNEYWLITHSGAGTDNSFLFILATTGVVGFTAFIYLIFSMFYLARNNFKNNIFSVILFASISGLIVNSIFVNSFFYVFIMEWIWIMASLTENK